MNRTIVLSALCLLSLSAIANAADFAIKNATEGDYDHIYLAPQGTTQWGPDLAAGTPDKTLDSGKTFRATGIKPGVYDVKLTDDDDALNVCILKNVAFTAEKVDLVAPGGKCHGHG